MTGIFIIIYILCNLLPARIIYVSLFKKIAHNLTESEIVISSNPSFTESLVRFTLVPFKLLSETNGWRYPCLFYLKLIIFNYGSLLKGT